MDLRRRSRVFRVMRFFFGTLGHSVFQFILNWYLFCVYSGYIFLCDANVICRTSCASSCRSHSNMICLTLSTSNLFVFFLPYLRDLFFPWILHDAGARVCVAAILAPKEALYCSLIHFTLKARGAQHWSTTRSSQASSTTDYCSSQASSTTDY